MSSPLNGGTTFQTLTAPKPENCEIVISRKKMGIPTRNSMIRNAMTNALPPFLKHKYGNLQTLPRPTANPKIIILLVI